MMDIHLGVLPRKVNLVDVSNLMRSIRVELVEFIGFSLAVVDPFAKLINMTPP